MDQLKAHVEFLRFGIEYNLTKAGVAVRDERGAISTEMAVVMAGPSQVSWLRCRRC